MSTELIHQVTVRPDGVYLNSKSNNDDHPFRTWKCDSLTEVYNQEGQRGLDREVVRMLCEYATIRGHHPSMERYSYCLMARGHFGIDHVARANAEYDKLTPFDLATQHLPDKQKSAAMKAYLAFEAAENDRYYAELASIAMPSARTVAARKKDEAR